MGPVKHLVAGVIAGGVFYAASRDPITAALACVASFGSDADHAAEYAVYCIRRRKKPEWAEFSSGRYFQAKGTIVVGLHAYEYIAALLAALLVCLSLRQHAALYWGAALVGYSLHLALDVIGNDFGIKGYSLIYRASMRFSEDKLCEKSRSHINGKS